MLHGESKVRTFPLYAIAVTLLLAASWPRTLTAQEESEEATAEEGAEAETKSWTNESDLSLVVTEGNASAQTLGFRNLFQKHWQKSRFQLKLNGTQSKTAESSFRLVDPGFTWEPGEDPPPVTSTVIEPESEPDVEQYFIEGRYDSQITERLTWNVGASWDRNLDAGISSRTIVFGGLGNIWWDREDLLFNTSYGLSYTDRQDVTPDPERDDQFTGARFNWQYMNMWGKVTTYRNDWTINTNISDPQDFSFDMINSVAVKMTDHLALKVSLQFLYNNIPALEDVDVVAVVRLEDPDGIPGNGDEYFETVADGGLTLELGTVQETKQKLDTVFNTSLVVSF